MSAEVALLVAAVMAASWFAKGVTGVGGPLVAIPVTAGLLGVQRAVILLAIPGAVANFWLLWAHRSQRRRTRDLPMLLATGVAGTALGTVVLLEIDERLLAGALACLIGTYLLLLVLRPDLALTPRASRRLSPLAGVLSGVVQGSTGVSSPVVATYLHAYRLDPATYVFSVTALFGVFSATQVLSLATLGAYTVEALLESLLAVVPVVVALPLGIRLARALDPRVFELVVRVLLAVMGVKLAWDALAG